MSKATTGGLNLGKTVIVDTFTKSITFNGANGSTENFQSRWQGTVSSKMHFPSRGSSGTATYSCYATATLKTGSTTVSGNSTKYYGAQGNSEGNVSAGPLSISKGDTIGYSYVCTIDDSRWSIPNSTNVFDRGVEFSVSITHLYKTIDKKSLPNSIKEIGEVANCTLFGRLPSGEWWNGN